MLVALGDTLWEPEVALLPLQAPEALQEVAFVEPQDRVLLEPEVMVVGLADRETVGASGGGTPHCKESGIAASVEEREAICVVFQPSPGDD